MNDFEIIWEKFEYIIEEMLDGLAFFEGYLLNLSPEKLDSAILSLSSHPLNATFDFSIWSNESTKEEWEKSYTPEEYIEFFKSQKIILLQTEYLTFQNEFELHLKLIIEEWKDNLIAEIICYRTPILSSHNPKYAIKAAITEFIRLKDLFGGGSLFIGPDTLKYPENNETYPSEWIKIAD